MGLIDTIKKHFGYPVTEPISVYCQSCGNDITANGGDVSNSGNIYCNGYKEDGDSRCLDRELLLFSEGKIKLKAISIEYNTPEKVQKAIKKRKLLHYGLLEEKII